MGKRGPGATPDGEARDPYQLRLSPSEAAQIEAVRAERADSYMSETIRDLPQIWRERGVLMREGLALLRGQLSRAETGAILDVQNGCHLLIVAEPVEMLGASVALNIADTEGLGEKWGVDAGALARKVHGAPRVARIALELWAGWLWQRHQEDDLWDRERSWLAGEVASWREQPSNPLDRAAGTKVLP